jgi:hypothetical protein
VQSVSPVAAASPESAARSVGCRNGAR